MIEVIVNQTIVKGICYDDEKYFVTYQDGRKPLESSYSLLRNLGWKEELNKIDVIVNRKKKLEKLLS